LKQSNYEIEMLNEISDGRTIDMPAQKTCRGGHRKSVEQAPRFVGCRAALMETALIARL